MPFSTLQLRGLPERSVIMARRRKAAPQPVPYSENREPHHPLVMSEGNPQAELVFIGEVHSNSDAESAQDALQAAQLLYKMIEAIGLSRDQIYICNLVRGEKHAHEDYLQQLGLVQPKLIVTLGKFASQLLLQTETPISQLRGHFSRYKQIRLLPTYHPTYLLKNPSSKKEAWEDMQKVAAELGLRIPQKQKG